MQESIKWIMRLKGLNYRIISLFTFYSYIYVTGFAKTIIVQELRSSFLVDMKATL